MKRISLLFSPLLLLASVCFIANAVAEKGPNPGYLSSAFGPIVKDVYTRCVHTIHFDKVTDGKAECGEANPVAAPIQVALPEPKIITEIVTISDEDNVLFNFNKASLSKNGEIVLNDFVNKVNHQKTAQKITIDGYTDAMGKEAYNMKLSQDRAKTVRNLFINKGYPQDKIIAQGFGPKDAKKSSQCFAQYGADPLNQMWLIQAKLEKKPFKAKHLNKNLAKQKKMLEKKLAAIAAHRNKIITCTASDRKVVFIIEHTQTVQKVVDTKATTNASETPIMPKIIDSKDVQNIEDSGQTKEPSELQKMDEPSKPSVPVTPGM